jgi:hypothetical protein
MIVRDGSEIMVAKDDSKRWLEEIAVRGDSKRWY